MSTTKGREPRRHKLQRRRRDGGKFAVDDQHLRPAVLQNEGDPGRIQPDVERIEHGAQHRHTEMRLEQFRHIRCHHRNRVPAADAGARQRRGEAPAPDIAIAPVDPARAVYDADMIGIDRGGAGEKAQWRQRHVVGGSARHVIGAGGSIVRHVGFLPRTAPMLPAIRNAEQGGRPPRLAAILAAHSARLAASKPRAGSDAASASRIIASRSISRNGFISTQRSCPMRSSSR